MSSTVYQAFEPGQQVRCETRFDDVYEGEVVAFDLNSNILIIKSPSSSGNTSNRDLHLLMLDSMRDVKLLEESQADCAKDLPNLEMRFIQSRQKTALTERLQLVDAVSKGVSKDGISLFLSLTKKYDRPEDLGWNDKVKIVVMNSVIIKPPYKESDCELLNPKSSEALGYVKSIVRKFWENL